MVYFYIDPATHFMDFFIHLLVHLRISHTLRKKKTDIREHSHWLVVH